jgi:hypothetical protein
MTRIARDSAIYRAVNHLAHKAEKLDEGIVTAAFVDMGHVDRIRNPTSQYIEGRRGTGKTHLLMYLASDVNLRLRDEKAIAAYLDVRGLRAESGEEPGDARGTAKRIFRELVAGIVAELRDIDSRYLWHNEVPTSRSPDEWRAAQRSREALAALENALRGEPIATRPPKVTEENAISSSREGKLGVDLSLGSQVTSPLKVAATANASLSQGSSSQIEETSEYEYRLAFGAIRQALEAFLAANDLACLYVCIDEWSSIPMGSQPLVAEYIKRTLLTSEKIAVKIAVLPFLSRLNTVVDGEQVGFDRGGDIYAGLDLDNELVFARHPVRSQSLLTRLLFNHLKFLSEQADSIFYATPEEAIEDLFTDPALRRLLVFSQGNPRDFLTLFRHAYLSFYDSTAQEIGTRAVELAAKTFGIEKLENIRENGDAQELFNRIIEDILQKERENTFLVHTRHAQHDSLLFLIHHRALHVWDESYSSPNVAGERFMVVAIDYSIISEHLKSPGYRQILELPFTDDAISELRQEKERRDIADRLLSTEKPDKRSARYKLLSDTHFKAPHRTTCHKCGEEYSQKHPVVEKAKICPHCAEPL